MIVAWTGPLLTGESGRSWPWTEGVHGMSVGVAKVDAVVNERIKMVLAMGQKLRSTGIVFCIVVEEGRTRLGYKALGCKSPIRGLI